MVNKILVMILAIGASCNVSTAFAGRLAKFAGGAAVATASGSAVYYHGEQKRQELEIQNKILADKIAKEQEHERLRIHRAQDEKNRIVRETEFRVLQNESRIRDLRNKQENMRYEQARLRADSDMLARQRAEFFNRQQFGPRKLSDIL